MNKEAAIANKLLKALKVGAIGAGAAGALGGAGYLGHQIGYKGGATKATNEMASAFSEANARENKQIVDSFKLFNKKENAALASNYMRRGMALGAQLHATGKIKTPEEMRSLTKKSSINGEDMDKQAFIENLYEEAFEDELEKTAIGSMIMGGLKTLGKSYKSLASGAKSIYKQTKNMKGRHPLIQKVQKKGLDRTVKRTLKEGRPALIATGVGAAGVGGYAAG